MLSSALDEKNDQLYDPSALPSKKQARISIAYGAEWASALVWPRWSGTKSAVELVDRHFLHLPKDHGSQLFIEVIICVGTLVEIQVFRNTSEKRPITP